MVTQKELWLPTPEITMEPMDNIHGHIILEWTLTSQLILLFVGLSGMFKIIKAK